MPPRKRPAKPSQKLPDSSAANASPIIKSTRSSTVDLSSFFTYVDTDPFGEEFGAAADKKPRLNAAHSECVADDEIEVRYVEKQNLDALNSAVSELQAIVRTQNVQLSQQHAMLQRISAQLAEVGDGLRCSANGQPQKLRRKPFSGRDWLPLKSFADLLAFERTMDETEFRAYLMTIGGSTVLRMVHNIVGAVYTFRVQSGTTWKGKRTPDGRGIAKPALCSTRIPALIVDVCLEHFPRNTQAEVWTMFKKYMVHATDRQRRSAQQKRPEGAESDAESSEE